MLDRLEREYEDERWKAYFDLLHTIFEVERRDANYRAGLVAAQVLNAQRGKESDKVWTPEDFFPSLTNDESEPAEMTTAQTVEYLRRGFALYVPNALRQRVGLPDA